MIVKCQCYEFGDLFPSSMSTTAEENISMAIQEEENVAKKLINRMMILTKMKHDEYWSDRKREHRTKNSRGDGLGVQF